MLVETTAVLNEDSSGKQDHVLRLGGELAQMGAEILGDTDEESRHDRLEALAQLLLMSEDVELVDARREPSGQVVLRAKEEWENVGFRGELRVMEAPLGTDAALMTTIAPMTVEAIAAAAQGQKEPVLPDEWPSAQVEHRYTLEIPDGYRARKLAPELKRATDGVLLERRLVARSPHRIEGVLRFEITEARLPRQRLEKIYDGLEPAQRQPVDIEVEMVASTLAASGRLREAIAETRRLVGAHPAKAYYRSEHALMLLRAGLVESARAEARRATSLAPELAYAHQVLAFTLEHDQFGRQFAPGFDRAAALRARRRQFDLMGAGSRGAYELARLLSHDEQGRTLGPAAPLEEIASITRDPLAFKEGAALLRAQALLCLGRGGEAEVLIREHLTDAKYQSYLLAALAQARGVDAALAELPALSLGGDAAATPLLQATAHLLRARSYPLAAALAAAGAGVTSKLQREATTLTNLRRPEQRPPDPRPAAEALKRLQLACADPAAFKKAAPALLDPRAAAADPGERGETSDRYQEVCRSVLVTAGWPPAQWMIDHEVIVELAVSGDPQTGYRVRYRSPPSQSTITASVFYFNAPPGPPRYLGQGAAVAADEALRLATSGRIKEAAMWLGWAREASPALPAAAGARSPPVNEAFEVLWPDQRNEPTAVRETAAAVAAYSSRTAPRAISALQQAFDAAPAAQAARRRVLGRALLNAQYLAGGGAEADRTADLLEALDAGPVNLTGLRAMAAMSAGKCPKALALARSGAQRDPSAAAQRWHAQAAANCAAYDEAAQVLRKVVGAEGAEPGDDNNLAWYLGFAGNAPDEALAAARRAVQRNGRRSRSYLQTLALVAAQAGALGESRAALVDALGRAPAGIEPLRPPGAWLVVGATAEALGMKDDAIKAYRLVSREGRPELARTSSWALAQRRLAALTTNH